MQRKQPINLHASTLDFLHHDFPILQQMSHGKRLVYLDSSASAQKPQQVIDAMLNFYSHDYANVHRGIYELSERATQQYEAARECVRSFIHARLKDEIIFVRGTTEGINLIAEIFGRNEFKADDEIILSVMEHHSNIVPWYFLSEKIGVKLKIIPISDEGMMDLKAYQALFTDKTKLVAITHVSNVLGTINPIKDMVSMAHAKQVPVLIDGAQAIPHIPVNVIDLDCDFYTFSAHKAYGPTGIGVVYVKQEWLNRLPPYQGGGEMIETVSFNQVKYAKGPMKFEAGTPNIAGAIGLHAAFNYLSAIGMDRVVLHEQALLSYAEQRLASVQGLRIIGTAKPKVGVISFVLRDIHPHDIATILDQEGIAVRAGHHCAMPLMERYQLPATVRVSLGIYNTYADIDALIAGLQLSQTILG